jgi:Sec-independent protein translocase protein TatA
MDFLGIGIPEALFFVVILLIILGPADMVKFGRTLGTNLRKIMKSPTWQMVFSTSNKLRNLPNALAREAGIEELRQELKRETETIKKMREEMTAATQFNLPHPGQPHSPLPASLKPPTTSAPPVGEGDFAAWTTPAPSEKPSRPKPEWTNSILPPRPASPPPPSLEADPAPEPSPEPPSQPE